MNARRAALVLLSLLVLVGAGLLLAHKLREDEQESAATPALPNDISRIEIAHGDESFALFLSSGLWTLEADTDFPLDQTACRALADRLRLLSPVRAVEAAEKAQIGLDKPQCTVTAEDAQGVRFVYTVGAKNERENLYYLGLGDTVFFVEAADAEAFFLTPYDLAVDERPLILDTENIVSLSVRTQTGQWHYTLTCDADGYTLRGTLIDPANPRVEYPADPEQARALLKACGALYLFDCVEYRALSDEALEAYGLRTPTARVELVFREKGTQADETRVYLFGARENGRICLKIEGSDRIYTADETEAARFLAPDFGKLLIS